MRTPIRSTPLFVAAVCLVALAATMAPRAQARDADDCITAPNAAPPEGQHWWYRTDRAAKRKCWYLGPQDKNAAARKTARPERAARAAAAPADEDEDGVAETALPYAAPAAPAADMDARRAQPIEQAMAQGVPYLVDWSEMLKDSGVVASRDNALTGWAEDETASTAWALRGPAEPAPASAGKDDARLPQTSAAPSRAAKGAANGAGASPIGMPAIVIAAMMIAGGLCPTIVSLVRTRRRRRVLQGLAPPLRAPFDGPLPAFLQSPDATPLPAGESGTQGDGDRDTGRPYGGEAELRRILDGLQRRAA